jgi:CheY-like chemotaxis protein
MLHGDSADVVISDVGMPDMDGYQFMRRLRAEEAKGSRIPALALTAFATPFDMAELMIVSPARGST